jgi:predicted nucleotidyltransferase
VALPSFDATGDLPVGVFPATIAEVMARFGTGTVQRREVARRLQRIWTLASATKKVARFVVFGSFVSEEPEPNDVDVVLVMRDDFILKQISGEARMLFDHAVANVEFGASIFWYPESAAFSLGQLPIERWQLKRDKTRRGIVEIVAEEQP